MSRPQTSITSKRDEITDDDSINSRSIAGVPQEILGVVAADGVKVLANANGHIDLDELKKHQKTLHTALYTDEKEIDAAMMLETEYQREFDDAEVHIPFSHEGLHHSHILDFSEMPNLSQPVDHDHYDFHHQHEEHHEMDDMLLRGIDIAQRQNDEGLVHLYRGQIMCNANHYSDAIVQLETALEHYRHLNLFAVGDDSVSRSSGASSQSSRAAKRAAERGEKHVGGSSGEEEENKDRLDFCPHIYSILVEAYYNIEQFHRATSVAREWLQKYPKNISPYCSLAWVQMKQLQYMDCINTCTSAIKLLPETEGMMTLYSIRGQCKATLEQYEEAVADFKYVKEMESKNLARFAPEKAVFFKVDKASRPPFARLAPKSRPDITLRRKYGNRLSTPGGAAPLTSSGMTGNPWDLQPIAEPKDGTTFNMTETLTTRAESPGTGAARTKNSKSTIAVDQIRNYEVRSDIRRKCAKCHPKRDPVTRRSITNMRMGLSTDNRRGASPERVLLLNDVAFDRGTMHK